MASQSSSAGSAGGARSIAIEMPRLSSEEGTATLSAWLVAEGDLVEKGTLVAELETDKATVELESPAPGRIEALVVRAGTEGLKPGMLLARITPTGLAAEPPKSAAAETTKTPAPGSAQTAPSLSSSRSPATPLARRLADAEGLTLEGVQGSGLRGRIEKADVERVARAGPVTTSAQDLHERASAEASHGADAVATTPLASGPVRPSRSLGAATALGMPRPGVQLVVHCAMDDVLDARARLNPDPQGNRQANPPASSAGSSSVTLNDFVLRAAALALRDVPEANRRRAGEGFHSADGVDLALVVGTEAGPELIVLRDADRKGLAVLSEEIRARSLQARSNEPPAPEDPTASLLVTSFGRFGIESAHPMLPPEQVAVLAVGAVVEEPVVREGSIAVGSRIALTLVFDPGAAGGAVMSRLLAAIRSHLEDPLGMVL